MHLKAQVFELNGHDARIIGRIVEFTGMGVGAITYDERNTALAAWACPVACPMGLAPQGLVPHMKFRARSSNFYIPQLYTSQIYSFKIAVKQTHLDAAASPPR